MKFEQYYQHYLTLHQHPLNILLHLIGQLTTVWFVIIVYSSSVSLLWLFLTPFIVYPFAWSGHYFFEKNKPAAFTNPILAKLADLRMFYELVITGELKIGEK